MGTRSLTVVVDETGAEPEEITVLYGQCDGYLEGHGKDLAEFLDGFTIVNGIGQEVPKMANGAGCLAAQIIAHFKKGVGGFYLRTPGTRDCGEEYIYFVRATKDGVELRVDDVYAKKSIFKGTPKQLLAKVAKEKAKQEKIATKATAKAKAEA